MNGIIYYIFHIESGKGYVGRHNSEDLFHRFKIHARSKNMLGNSIRKYGKESFKVVLLDTGNSDQELYEKEIFWIDKLNTFGSDGFNLNSGGQGISGWNPSDLSRLAMSMAKKGYTFSEDHKSSLSKARKGIPKSEEHKKKISEAHKGKTHTKEHTAKAAFSWSSVTPELIKAIRAQPDKNAWDWVQELEYKIGFGTIRGIQTNKIFKDES